MGRYIKSWQSITAIRSAASAARWYGDTTHGLPQSLRVVSPEADGISVYVGSVDQYVHRVYPVLPEPAASS